MSICKMLRAVLANICHIYGGWGVREREGEGESIETAGQRKMGACIT